MTVKCSWGNLKMWPPFLHPSKKPSSPLQFGQKENIPGHSTERRAYWFILKIGRMFLILRSRNYYQHMQEIVYRISLCFSIPKDLPSPFSLARELIWKSSLLICFDSYQGIPYSHTGRVGRNVNTLLMVNINPISKR